MVDRVRPRADQRVERRVVIEVDGVTVLGTEGLHRRRLGNAMRETHAGAQHGHVALVIEKLGSITGAAAASALPSRTVPRLSGLSTQAWSEKPCAFTFSRP